MIIYNIFNSGGCVLPNQPNFGKWILPGGESFKPGQKAPVNSFLTYNCNSGYKLSRENTILACLNEGWTQSPPTCVSKYSPIFDIDQQLCKKLNNITIL